MSYELTEDLLDEIAEEFSCDTEDIEEGYDSEIVEIEGDEYYLLTDEEADEKIADYIADSLWTFRPSFLSQMTDLPEEVFDALVDKCENGNSAILKLVEKTCGIDEFIDEAVSCDGRGHFLNGYDGEEHEVFADGKYYYLYRI